MKMISMTKEQEKEAYIQMNRGDPRDLIRLFETEIKILQDILNKAGCKGCSSSYYLTQIKFLTEKIQLIKRQKKFRLMQL